MYDLDAILGHGWLSPCNAQGVQSLLLRVFPSRQRGFVTFAFNQTPASAGELESHGSACGLHQSTCLGTRNLQGSKRDIAGAPSRWIIRNCGQRPVFILREMVCRRNETPTQRQQHTENPSLARRHFLHAEDFSPAAGQAKSSLHRPLPLASHRPLHGQRSAPNFGSSSRTITTTITRTRSPPFQPSTADPLLLSLSCLSTSSARQGRGPTLNERHAAPLG